MPSSLSDLSEVHTLELRQNQFTTVAVSLHKLQKLEVLDLSSNKINEPIQVLFKKLQQVHADRTDRH